MISFFKKKEEKLEKKEIGFIKSIFSHKRLDEEALDDLEDMLIMSDIGVGAVKDIMKKLKELRVDKKSTDDEIRQELARRIEKVLRPVEKKFVVDMSKKPYVILMVGVNGAGKTTSIGKIAAKLKKEGLKVSLVAGDTFRAAAVEQLSVWGKRNDIRIFKGENGCNSAGLCYDGINDAIKSGDDVVLIDTAGRLQNKSHLMEELKKIVKVVQKLIPSAPHATLLTIDATTGQNALEQLRVFKEMLDVTGLIITKLDGTSKGGVLVAASEEFKIPVHYIGIGEGVDDLKDFDAKDFAEKLVGL